MRRATCRTHGRLAHRLGSRRADQRLLGERRHVDAVGAEHLPERQAPSAGVGQARHVVEVPRVDARRGVEPHAVVKAGDEAILGRVDRCPVGVGSNDGVARQIVLEIGQPTAVEQVIAVDVSGTRVIVAQ